MSVSRPVQDEIRKLDHSGRLTLGKDKAGEQYRVSESPDGTIVLTPVVVIPKRELWLWDSPEALASVKRGLEQAARGEGRSLGSFAEYADEPDDEE